MQLLHGSSHIEHHLAVAHGITLNDRVPNPTDRASASRKLLQLEINSPDLKSR
jgi:hypothetical protein